MSVTVWKQEGGHVMKQERCPVCFVWHDRPWQQVHPGTSPTRDDPFHCPMEEEMNKLQIQAAPKINLNLVREFSVVSRVPRADNDPLTPEDIQAYTQAILARLSEIAMDDDRRARAEKRVILGKSMWCMNTSTLSEEENETLVKFGIHVVNKWGDVMCKIEFPQTGNCVTVFVDAPTFLNFVPTVPTKDHFLFAFCTSDERTWELVAQTESTSEQITTFVNTRVVTLPKELPRAREEFRRHLQAGVPKTTVPMDWSRLSPEKKIVAVEEEEEEQPVLRPKLHAVSSIDQSMNQISAMEASVEKQEVPYRPTQQAFILETVEGWSQDKRYGKILADEMGLGKSRSVLGAVKSHPKWSRREQEDCNFLLVVPLNTRTKWIKEIHDAGIDDEDWYDFDSNQLVIVHHAITVITYGQLSNQYKRFQILKRVADNKRLVCDDLKWAPPMFVDWPSSKTKKKEKKEKKEQEEEEEEDETGTGAEAPEAVDPDVVEYTLTPSPAALATHRASFVVRELAPIPKTSAFQERLEDEIKDLSVDEAQAIMDKWCKRNVYQTLWDICILDEAHLHLAGTIKRLPSRPDWVEKQLKIRPGAQYLYHLPRVSSFTLTATPLVNRLHDMAALTHFIRFGPSMNPFFWRNIATWEPWQRETAQAIFTRRLYIDESSFVLPEKISTTKRYALTPLQLETENKIVRSQTMSVFKKMTAMRKNSLSVRLITDHTWEELFGKPSKSKIEEEHDNIYTAATWIVKILLQDPLLKILVFNEWVLGLELIREDIQRVARTELNKPEHGTIAKQILAILANHPFPIYSSEEHVDTRAHMVRTFQENKALTKAVLFLTPTSGGVGLDLQAASVVVHVGRWYQPFREKQATARAHRQGQVRKVTELIVQSSGGKDMQDFVYEIAQRKARLWDLLFTYLGKKRDLTLEERKELAQLESGDVLEQEEIKTFLSKKTVKKKKSTRLLTEEEEEPSWTEKQARNKLFNLLVYFQPTQSSLDSLYRPDKVDEELWSFLVTRLTFKDITDLAIALNKKHNLSNDEQLQALAQARTWTLDAKLGPELRKKQGHVQSVYYFAAYSLIGIVHFIHLIQVMAKRKPSVRTHLTVFDKPKEAGQASTSSASGIQGQTKEIGKTKEGSKKPSEHKDIARKPSETKEGGEAKETRKTPRAKPRARLIEPDQDVEMAIAPPIVTEQIVSSSLISASLVPSSDSTTIVLYDRESYWAQIPLGINSIQRATGMRDNQPMLRDNKDFPKEQEFIITEKGNNTPIANAYFVPIPGTLLWINGLVVDPKFRQFGLGTLLTGLINDVAVRLQIPIISANIGQEAERYLVRHHDTQRLRETVYTTEYWTNVYKEKTNEGLEPQLLQVITNASKPGTFLIESKPGLPPPMMVGHEKVMRHSQPRGLVPERVLSFSGAPPTSTTWPFSSLHPTSTTLPFSSASPFTPPTSTIITLQEEKKQVLVVSSSTLSSTSIISVPATFASPASTSIASSSSSTVSAAVGTTTASILSASMGTAPPSIVAASVTSASASMVSTSASLSAAVSISGSTISSFSPAMPISGLVEEEEIRELTEDEIRQAMARKRAQDQSKPREKRVRRREPSMPVLSIGMGTKKPYNAPSVSFEDAEIVDIMTVSPAPVTLPRPATAAPVSLSLAKYRPRDPRVRAIDPDD